LPSPGDLILIRWRRAGILIRGGMALKRYAGDEDFVYRREVQGDIDSGWVEILAPTVPKAVTVEIEDERKSGNDGGSS